MQLWPRQQLRPHRESKMHWHYAKVERLQAHNEHLLATIAQGVRFNLDSLLRGDTEARGEYYTKLWNIGALSQNDIRRRENMNPIEDGDKYYVPLNFQPIDEPLNTQNNEQ